MRDQPASDSSAHRGEQLDARAGSLSALLIVERTADMRARSHGSIAVTLDDEARIELAALEQVAIDAHAAGARHAQAEEGRAASRQRLLRHLAVLAEFRDDDTREHTDRVSRSAAIIAEAYGLTAPRVRMIAAAAMLHDIGKIAIPDRILLKPGRLSAGETELMRRHAQIGAALLASSGVPELRVGEAIALSHHERWDGSGYPFGLAGEAIPLAARIAAIADVFDALVHERPYKRAWSIEDALAEIVRQRGRQFDPELVDIFIRLDHERLVGAVRGGAAKRRAAIAAAIGPAPALLGPRLARHRPPAA
jgi:putative nucleotidyltransferase with HDIG domain